MAGLDDISSANPAGTEVPTLGDNRIRALAAKVIEYAAVSHTLAGKHKFARGPLASRPASGNSGDLYILEVVGLLAALQYDTGSAWVTLTSLNEIADIVAALATHIATNPIDHPDASVTANKILAGAILKKHLLGGGSTDPASIAALVNGTSADALHTHPKYREVVNPAEGEVTPGDLTNFAAGEVVFGRSSADHYLTTTMTIYTKLKEMQVLRLGTVTVKFTMNGRVGNIGQSFKVAIHKNSVIAGIERSMNVLAAGDPGGEGEGGIWMLGDMGATATYSENLTVAADDLVQVYGKVDIGIEDGRCSVADFEICASWDCIVNLD